MPFGLCNAPSTFQSLMNHVFRPFLHHFVLVFFDDIIIYRKTWTDHLTHVDQVLHLLSQHQLFLEQSKCAFGASEVEYLGHMVGKDGVRVDPKKIEAMQDWPHPKTSWASLDVGRLSDGQSPAIHHFQGLQVVMRHEEVQGYQGLAGIGKEAFHA
jgi:hypothetical protein